MFDSKSDYEGLTREDLAEIFREKANESLAAAESYYELGRPRSTCNRAWYAIYQSIAAGVYARLKQDPPADNGSWKHNALVSLFNHLLRASKRRTRYGYVVEWLDEVRRARVVADYLPDHHKVLEDSARNALATAQVVHSVIWEICQWQATAPAMPPPAVPSSASMSEQSLET